MSMPALPANRKPTSVTGIADNGKPVPPKIAKAIEHLYQGATQGEAAAQAGVTRKHLNRALGTNRAQEHIRRVAKRLRTTELLPASHVTLKGSIEAGNHEAALVVMKEEGIVSRSQGTGQPGAGGVSLSIVIAPQAANPDPQHVDSSPIIDVSASHNAEDD